MNGHLTIKFLVFLFCSSISVGDWVDTDMSGIYPFYAKSECAFPFDYNDNTYMDCTTDGDNGDIPWCSMSSSYQGLIRYCIDFYNTTIKCLPSFTMPDGKVYNGCDYLSASQPYKQCKTNHTTFKYIYCTDNLKNPVRQPTRLKNCNRTYFDISKDHTMCFSNPLCNAVPLTATEKQAILDLHNKYRSAVPSRYMFKLHWDDELAKIAQARANLGVFEHDQAINRMSPQFKWLNGQNLVMSTEIRSTPAALFDMMFSSEKPRFRYGKTCSPNENSCLHYTQLMISNLTRVGCGQSHCIYYDRIERYVVCNYIQSQYEDTYQTPYIPSVIRAVDCPSKNSSGLCDCGPAICKYDQNENLEPNTCTCIKTSSKRSIDGDDANEEELEPYQTRNVLISDGKRLSKSNEKREIKIIKTISASKRSIGNIDVNDEELKKYAGESVLIRDGQIPSESKNKHKIKGIENSNPSKRAFKEIYNSRHKHKNNTN